MEETTVDTSHSAESQEAPTIPQVDDQKQAVNDALSAFGLDVQKQEEKPTEQNVEGEKVTPPTEQPETPKGITVKYNKEDTFVDDEKIPEYVRKGLNYEKVEGRANEYQQALDELAQLQGYKDHSELISNLPKLKQEREQKQQTEFDQLRQNMIQQYEEAGGDPAELQTWLDNHPMLKQAQEVLERDKEAKQSQERAQKFDSLYAAFPELKTQIKEDGSAEWYTPQMHELVEAGTPPIIAYKALNAESIAERKAKAAEQKAIKDVQLGRRAQVDAPLQTDTEPTVPDDVASAFEAFGLPAQSAKKYLKK